MRLLIDGYNLMHAVVLPPGRRLGPDQLRRMRQRFLNDLARKLGPIDTHQATVVFDSTHAPEGLPREARHKGMTILFAGENEDADERIEDLIRRHTAPKNLTVVSSDHRVRRAARRRHATDKTSDLFWAELQERERKPRILTTSPDREPPRERADSLSPEERAQWLEEFAEIIDSHEAREAFRTPDFAPSDEELARITREVEEEFRGGGSRRR